MQNRKRVFNLNQTQFILYFERSIDIRKFIRFLKIRIKYKFFSFRIQTGPKSVQESLIAGLIRIRENSFPSYIGNNIKQIHWLISGNIENFVNQDLYAHKSTKILLGPNVEFNKNIAAVKRLISHGAVILVPSSWIVPVLTKRLDISSDNIAIWAAGVDHEKWSPSSVLRNNTLIYIKSDLTNELDIIKKYLIGVERNFLIMKYGMYTENEFRLNLEICDSAIWMGETESQGIALLETWSMGVPTLVRKRKKFFDPIAKDSFDASAAPYLEADCGQFSENDLIQVSDLDSFFCTLGQRNPRKFVIENFTNEIATNKLLSIIFK